MFKRIKTIRNYLPSVNLQKQPPEVFYEKRCSQKFHKIHRKASVPESQACNFIKKETLAKVFSCEFCEISKNTFFTEHLWVAASEFVTDRLIFRSRCCRSHNFFKIRVLKNFAILEPISNNKAAGLPTVTASDFLRQQILFCSWIWYLLLSRAGFCSGLLWKHELYLRSSHWSCSVKKMFLENLQISQQNSCVEVSFY